LAAVLYRFLFFKMLSTVDHAKLNFLAMSQVRLPASDSSINSIFFLKFNKISRSFSIVCSLRSHDELLSNVSKYGRRRSNSSAPDAICGFCLSQKPREITSGTDELQQSGPCVGTWVWRCRMRWCWKMRWSRRATGEGGSWRFKTYCNYMKPRIMPNAIRGMCNVMY
jgi:hypothetical protein